MMNKNYRKIMNIFKFVLAMGFCYSISGKLIYNIFFNSNNRTSDNRLDFSKLNLSLLDSFLFLIGAITLSVDVVINSLDMEEEREDHLYLNNISNENRELERDSYVIDSSRLDSPRVLSPNSR